MVKKRDFLLGRECIRKMWLAHHRKDLQDEYSVAVLDRIDTGKQIGLLARKRYIQGIEAAPGIYDPFEASRATWDRIEEGSPILFEATLLNSQAVARFDILWQNEDGSWTIDEVKSSSAKDPEELVKKGKHWDLAYQLLVARDAGLHVARARMVLIDTDYVWDGGEYPAELMLQDVDLTQACEDALPEVRRTLDICGAVLTKTSEPPPTFAAACKKCDYFEHCYRDAPKHSVIHLPKITDKAYQQLTQEEIHCISDIPDDWKLNARQQVVRDVVRSGIPFISNGLAEALDAIKFPAAFIDYESSNPAFPSFPGTRPYQQVCFQWSTHYAASADSDLEHREFLPHNAEDPRAEFCRSLWEILEHAQSIVHYSAFEKTQLRAMANEGVPHAADLYDAIEERTVDLEKIILSHVYLPEFMGRSSIKVVLPALVPTMSYKNLMIGDGGAASAGYREMIHRNTPLDRRIVLREALLEYCKQDTLAMVEIYRRLRTLAASPTACYNAQS